MRDEPRMVEVELTDEPDGDTPNPGAHDPGAHDRGAHDGGAHDGGAHDGGAHDRGAEDSGAPDRGARARHRTLLGVAAVAVAALVGTAVQADRAAVRADEALVAAHADVAGFAASLREPPAERWRAARPVGAVGPLVLTEETVGDAPRTVALDAATGAPRWVLPGPVAGDGGLWCPTTAAGDALLLCEAPGDAVPAPNTDVVLEGSRPDRLVALDVTDGSEVARHDLPSRTVGWATLGEDVVVASRTGGLLRVEAWDLRTGAVRWTTDLPGAVPESGFATPTLGVRDGYVVLTGALTAVLAQDGRVLGSWPVRTPGAEVRVETTALGFAVWTGGSEGTWFDASGTPGARLPGGYVGPVWQRPLDGGDDPSVVLVEGAQGLQAVECSATARSGSERPSTAWSCGWVGSWCCAPGRWSPPSSCAPGANGGRSRSTWARALSSR